MAIPAVMVHTSADIPARMRIRPSRIIIHTRATTILQPGKQERIITGITPPASTTEQLRNVTNQAAGNNIPGHTTKKD